MTEPVTTQRNQPQLNNTKVNIGGITFDKNQIEADKTRRYTLNGRNMNSVFVKPGIKIDYPDQTKNNASVESIGLRQEWYNPDVSNIHINNVDNATIQGNPNLSDYIQLTGTSSNNRVIVDQKESWYISSRQRQDRVELGPLTYNNKVQMDKSDTTKVHYNKSSVGINEYPSDELGTHIVKEEGTCSQEQIRKK